MSIKIIAVIVGAIVVVGGALYALGIGGAPDGDGLPQEDHAQAVSERFDGDGPLAELMKKGKSMKCDFGSQEGGVDSEGTFYFDYKNERFRVDVTSLINSEPFVTHMINDGEKIYSWGTSMDKGMIMSADMSDINESSPFEDVVINNDSGTSMDVEADVAYDCVPWRVQENIFVPDTSVEFVDMQAMMEGMLDGLPGGFDPETLRDLESM